MFENNEGQTNSQITSPVVSPERENSENNFTIPDKYKNQDWAKNITSVEELWDYKAESSQETDFKNLSPEDIKKYFSKFAPDSIDDYKIFDALKNDNGEQSYEINEDVVNYFGNHFKELGIPADIGNNLFKLYAKYELEQFNKLTDVEDLNSRLRNIFGNDDKSKKICEGIIKEALPKEDLQKINDYMPNHFLEIMYRMAKNVSDKYGYKEPLPRDTGRYTTGEYMSKQEKDAKYLETYNKLQGLKRRAHTKEEKDSLIAELEKYV